MGSPDSARSPHERPTQNRPLAVTLLIITTLIFAAGDATAKFLAANVPAIQMVFVRCVVVVAITVPIAVWRIGPGVFRSEYPTLQVVRGVAILISSFLFVTGLFYLPLAEMSAINFIWPVLITVLSVLFLGEKVGIRRWTATAVGFLGMLLIVRPGTSAFQPAAIYPLGAALMWSIAAVITRGVSLRDRAETTLVWTSIVMLVGSAIFIPFYWVAPSPRDMALMIAIGLLSVLGHSILVYAYERATASSLAPFAYLQLVWATSIGFIVWGSIPDIWIASGALLIVGSGIYTAHRERIRANEARASEAQQDAR